MITPADIENKDFTRAKRGYDMEEVDEFLDLIIVDMERLMQENRRLKEELGKANTQVDKHMSTEKSIYETLEAAKQLMNDIAASAERRAEVLLRNAELDASLITREAKENISRYTEEGNRLMKSVDILKERYKGMLKDELERMESVGAGLFEEFEADFLPASMTGYSEKEEDRPEVDIFGGNLERETDESDIDLSKTMVIRK